LDFHHVVEQRAVEPMLDLVGCGMERALPSGTRRTSGISCEELEFVGSSGKAEEFDD
jgi:hypothetical protein